MSEGIIKIIAPGSKEFFTRFQSTVFSNGTNLGTIEDMLIETIGTKGTPGHKDIMVIPLSKTQPGASRSDPQVVWNVDDIHSINEFDDNKNPIKDIYGTEISERVTRMFNDQNPQGILLIPLIEGKPIKEHQNGTIIVQ
jgi:hypothetical protein